MLRAFKLSRGRLVEQDSRALGPEQLRESAWIDLQEPTQDERRVVDSFKPASLPESGKVEEIEHSARYFTDGHGIHVHSSFLYQSEGRTRTCTVACTLQPDQLLTLRDVDLADFRLLRLRARRGQVEADSPLGIFTLLFDQKVENLADSIEDLHRELQNISYKVLEDESADMEDAIDDLARLEDSNGKIRLCLIDTHRSLSFLVRHIRQKPKEIETCQEVLRDLDTLMAHTSFLFDKVNFLMDAAQGFISIEQNRVIKIFSIAAVVFLPPTLVASIYGMNFRFMPELGWIHGYPMAIGLMVLAALAPYWYFKHNNWL